MEPSISSASLIQENVVLGVILIIVGAMFLFAGAWIYYSAIRVFGSIMGAIIGVMICYSMVQSGNYIIEGVWLFVAYLLSAFFGAMIGGTLSIVFHYIIFFVTGAFVALILYEMAVQGLVLPEAFQNLTPEEFIQLVIPDKLGIETVVMIVGGIIYMASAHLIIVLSLSVLGAFMIAYALDIYILFPILAIVGSILQYLVTRSYRRKVVVRRRIIGG